jgi:hypoxanthine phosphoribosyltransferase
LGGGKVKKIKIIILSSSEALDVAEAIQRSLLDKDNKYSCRLWIDNIFELSTTSLDSLQSIKRDVDFSVVILSPDDSVVSRGLKTDAPRDNVIFELGLCIGLLGLERTIIVNYPDVKLPTDIKGLTTCRVKPNPDVNISARFVVSDIGRFIDKAIEDGRLNNRIYWEEYSALVNKFLDKVKKSDHKGSSFQYDAILSISRSGTMLAELVARTYGYNVPVFYLVKGRGKDYGKYDSPDVRDRNSDVVRFFNEKEYKNVLVLNGMSSTENAVINALQYLGENCRGISFKTGVLIADEALRHSRNLDFVAEYRENAENVDFFYKIFR